ncbi:hypothetical protein CMQ_5140 [Grosmannia clavigera kw1407]|uniref:Uncharacterized protein n=1 Tax=Grosmannia clavigera (strain kw1407 / UAMH 11150) TaxID=655863 RepID=F0XBK7_GROCL|nr:uncharacterized protein CMQ_5140 [Grosmannia clavigera kw1407]EFX04878.1 hypothetical protein CMQ_5140 [Grosmannia clavigera kw1407]
MSQHSIHVDRCSAVDGAPDSRRESRGHDSGDTRWPMTELTTVSRWEILKERMQMQMLKSAAGSSSFNNQKQEDDQQAREIVVNCMIDSWPVVAAVETGYTADKVNSTVDLVLAAKCKRTDGVSEFHGEASGFYDGIWVIALQALGRDTAAVVRRAHGHDEVGQPM